MSADKAYTLEELKSLGVVGEAQKTNFVPSHGINSLLSAPGVRPDMYQTIIRPQSLASVIPWFGSEFERERIEILTGQTADEGANAADWCSTPPQSGNLKVCQQNFLFGDFYMRTKTIKFMEAIARHDRSDVDRVVINNPADFSPFMPTILNGGNINTVYGKELLEFGLSAERNIARMMSRGDATVVNGAGSITGFIDEFNGTDLLIAEGKTDAVSGVACPAADPLVTDYGNGLVSAALYTHMDDIVRTVVTDAEALGLNVDWAWRIHPRMRYTLLDTVACNWASTRCEITDTNGRRLDVTSTRELLKDMSTRSYIPHDGMMIPLLTDAGMANTLNQATNQYTADIELIPLRINGRWTTYGEYLKLDNSNAASLIAALNMGNRGRMSIINNGMYAVVEDTTSSPGCFSWHFMARLRLIMRGLFVAAKIENVNFVSNTPIRSPYSDETYYVDGGRYIRNN